MARRIPPVTARFRSSGIPCSSDAPEKARHIRKALSLLPFCLLGACASKSDLVQAGSVLLRYVGGSNVKIAREQAEAIPYATMALELGPNPQAAFDPGYGRKQ